MASFFVVVAVVAGLFVAIIGVRRLRASGSSSAVEAGCVITSGTNSEVQLARQTLKVAGIFSAVRNVDSTAFAMPTVFELWVKENDAERARDALGIDPEP